MQTLDLSRAQRFAHPRHTVGALAIDPGMVAADFGSGSGHYVFEMAEAGARKVYAIDVQQDLLRRIRNEAQKRGLESIETIRGDVEKPHGSRIADQSVDFVLLSNVLFQLEDKKAALLEARRIIKPAGRIAVIDWADSYNAMGPVKEHVVEKKEAQGLAESAGFELMREFHAGAHHYGLMFRPVARKEKI